MVESYISEKFGRCSPTAKCLACFLDTFLQQTLFEDFQHLGPTYITLRVANYDVEIVLLNNKELNTRSLKPVSQHWSIVRYFVTQANIAISSNCGNCCLCCILCAEYED